MDTVLILIASLAAGARLGSRHVDAARAILGGGKPRWLSPDEAVELRFKAASDFAAAPAEHTLREAFAGEAVDVAIVPARDRRKKLLIADMDSTMIGQECIDELARIAGVGDEVAAVTARAMAGEIDFEDAMRQRVARLAGLSESAIAKVIAERLTFTPGGRELVATMKAHGAKTALVSGGFTPFTAHVAATCGFDTHQANTLIVENARLTGKVEEPILGRNAKVEALRALLSRHRLKPEQSLAVGDGANDIPMLETSGLGVALHGKATVRERADVRIDHGDLTALLFLQGYARDAFAPA